jgi:NAD(P)-dependent dehydrogenase (short-subunit alcohol dehydrogenase family)
MSDLPMEARPILERFRLDGRVALVTGGGQGIGRALAHALGEAGASVAVAARRKELVENVADELEKKGAKAIALTGDVTNNEQVQKMVDLVIDHWGTLTIGVNNAGFGRWVDAEDATDIAWHETIDVNMKGVYFCAQAEAKAMFPKKYGKIINIASMSGYIVNRPQKASIYNISKAGVLHLTRCLAAEWAPKGILVNSISPGYTLTAQLEINLTTPQGRAMVPQWISHTPLGRMAELNDLQGAVVFLSSEVSDFITGADLLIDGGYTCW